MKFIKYSFKLVKFERTYFGKEYVVAVQNKPIGFEEKVIEATAIRYGVVRKVTILGLISLGWRSRFFTTEGILHTRHIRYETMLDAAAFIVGEIKEYNNKLIRLPVTF